MFLSVESEIVSIDKNNKTINIIGVGIGRETIKSEIRVDCSFLEDDSKIFVFNSDTEKIKIIKFNDLKVS